MSILLLAAVLLGCLFLIPLGLPGTWLMIGAALVYSLIVPEATIGLPTLIGTTLLALAAEVVEFLLAGRYARRYGGSRRAEWGAIIGGLVGALVGVPVYLVGAVLGAFLGAFAGALIGELTLGSGAVASTRAAIGALIGRVVASAMKVVVGVVIAVWALLAAWQ
ncbi:MAG TPA: DUF456 domain-containing protein [Gemmatimonadaceae bacterium]|nr:DUF456 domain-containing protein [Gemmatimonadaceae bacterium]